MHYFDSGLLISLCSLCLSALLLFGCDSSDNSTNSIESTTAESDQPNWKGTELSSLSHNESQLILALTPDTPLNADGQRCASLFGYAMVSFSQVQDTVYDLSAVFFAATKPYTLIDGANSTTSLTEEVTLSVASIFTAPDLTYFSLGLDISGDIKEGSGAVVGSWLINTPPDSLVPWSSDGSDLPSFFESEDLLHTSVSPSFEEFHAQGNFYRSGRWQGSEILNPGCSGSLHVFEVGSERVDLTLGESHMEFHPLSSSTYDGQACESFFGVATVTKDDEEHIRTTIIAEPSAGIRVSFGFSSKQLVHSITPQSNHFLHGNVQHYMILQGGLNGEGQEWVLSNGCFGSWVAIKS